MNEPEYQISKDDILSMLRLLRHVAPTHATPEKAIFILERLHAQSKNAEELGPEAVEEILKDFESY